MEANPHPRPCNGPKRGCCCCLFKTFPRIATLRLIPDSPRNKTLLPFAGIDLTGRGKLIVTPQLRQPMAVLWVHLRDFLRSQSPTLRKVKAKRDSFQTDDLVTRNLLESSCKILLRVAEPIWRKERSLFKINGDTCFGDVLPKFSV